VDYFDDLLSEAYIFSDPVIETIVDSDLGDVILLVCPESFILKLFNNGRDPDHYQSILVGSSQILSPTLLGSSTSIFLEGQYLSLPHSSLHSELFLGSSPGNARLSVFPPSTDIGGLGFLGIQLGIEDLAVTGPIQGSKEENGR
jgi:hypothetical protein